jgi:ABC-type transport system involved in multi-copper enzyme maturation permease subunit
MALFGSALAIIATTQLFYGEIEHRTALTLLAKPVRRSEFLLGKFFGAWATTSCFLLMLTLALLTALWLREGGIAAEIGDAQGFVDYGAVLQVAFAQCLRVGVLCALLVLFSSYASSSMFAMIMGLLVWIAGQLQHIATEAWSVADGLFLKGVYLFLSLILPNFHLFDLGDYLFSGDALSWGVYLNLFLYSLLYTAFYLALAVASFNRREL